MRLHWGALWMVRDVVLLIFALEKHRSVKNAVEVRAGMKRGIFATDQVGRTVWQLHFPFVSVSQEGLADVLVSGLPKTIVVLQKSFDRDALPSKHNFIASRLIEARQLANMVFVMHPGHKSGQYRQMKITPDITFYWFLAWQCDSLHGQFNSYIPCGNSPWSGINLTDKYRSISAERAEDIQLGRKYNKSPVSLCNFLTCQTNGCSSGFSGLLSGVGRPLRDYALPYPYADSAERSDHQGSSEPSQSPIHFDL